MNLSAANQPIKKPDFAFPEKVEKEAAADLKAALKKGDGAMTVNALIRMGLAKANVNSDSLPSVLARIDEIARTEKNEVTRALLNGLQAKIYAQLYEDDCFVISDRETVASAGDDYRLWSRRQFAERIDSLVAASLSPAEALMAASVKDYARVIDIDDSAVRFYPTVYDFLAAEGIANLSELHNGATSLDVLNSTLLETPFDSSLYPGEASAPVGEILRIYRTVIERNSQRPAVRFHFMEDMLLYIGEHLFESTDVADTFLKLYVENQNDEYSVLFLLQYTSQQGTAKDAAGCAEAVDLLEEYQKRFPKGLFANNIANELSRLTAPWATLSFPGQVVKGVPVTGKLTAFNAWNVNVDVYDVTKLVKPLRDSSVRYPRKGQLVDTKEIKFEKSFASAGKDVEITLPEYGLYAICLSIDGDVWEERTRLIRCSDLALATLQADSMVSALVVNPLTGAPVEGGKVLFSTWSNNKAPHQLSGQTDADGMMPLKLKEYGQLTPLKGDDRFASSGYAGTTSKSNTTERLAAQVFTSLGLYRPGDEVEFAVVAYRNDEEKRTIASDVTLAVELMDANYQSVDTVRVTTDVWGRTSSKITLPVGSLQGNYNLRVRQVKANILGNVIGDCYFKVNDYKLPTFEVVPGKIIPPKSVAQSAVVSGKATTYAGFPVADAKVKGSVKVSSGFWWWTETSPVLFEAEVTTGENGEYEMIIPAEVFASSPAPKGRYTVDISVTSPAGETKTAQSVFTMGYANVISVNIPTQIDVCKPFTSKVEVADLAGKTVDAIVDYKITDNANDDFERKGVYDPSAFAETVRKLKAGKYSVIFATQDAALAQATEPQNIIVYDSRGGDSPEAKPLWVPENVVTADQSGCCHVVVGSADGDAHLLAVTMDATGRQMSQQWSVLSKGMQTVDFQMPPQSQSMQILLFCVKDFERCEYHIDCKRADSLKAIKVEVSSFRDNVTPGQTEKITLRISPENGATAQSAVLLDMTNKAIEALAPNTFALSPFRLRSKTLDISGMDFSRIAVRNQWSIKHLSEFEVLPPEFNLYNRSFVGGGRQYFSAHKRGRAMAGGMYDEECDMLCAAPSAASNGHISVEMSRKEADFAEEKMEDTADGGNADTPDKRENYRPSEVPLALFRPLLATREDGSLEISYEVPQANTTWVLKAMAYNREWLTSETSVDIVASKPVMVSLNAPSYLRSGDRCRLLASVMNATDSLQQLSVKMELIDAATMLPVASADSVLSLEGKAQGVVSIPLEVNGFANGIVLRVKASNDSFSDGEQSLIPILPNEQNVVESEIFYIPADEAHFSISLSENTGDDSTWLNFTENPSWEVVSALPGLRDMKINSSVEAAAALFSASVAQGIIHDNPEIAKVLRAWVANPADSALVSQLEKNKELKSLLLSATPWVQQSMSQTQRMQRLALLFDKRQTSDVIAQAVDLLAKTNIDGGWCWTTSYKEVSPWATSSVLDMLGDLNRLGWLPADARLQRMITSACAYYDRYTADQYAKYPKSNYWLYVAIRDKFPRERMSLAAKKVVEAQVQRCVRDWRGESIALKGVYALILNHHGYNATARQILQSLREYATVTPQKGMWWQQFDRQFTLWSFDRVGVTSIILEAFHAVEPSCEDVEKIRQWLFLNKTNNDWGDATITSQVIASILTSGRKLNVNSRATAVRVGETLIEPSQTEYATGAYNQNVSELLAAPTTLTIDRQADYPSVGAVVTMRTLPMAQVKAVGCDQAKIEKELSVFDGTQWVEADTVAVGQRVKVSLTLRVEDDLQYVVIEDQRPATLQPVDQLSMPIYSEGLCFYRETRDAATNLFIHRLPRGVYRLEYELFASVAGTFSSGVATLQSQYNPIVAAHSAGRQLLVK